jgi:glyceraldehyde-3-phosphate dehydrogenase (NADP+)
MNTTSSTEPAHFPLYVGGEFKSTQQTLKVINSYSSECVFTTCLGGQDEFETAVTSACSVQETMRDLPIYQRFQILMDIANKLRVERSKMAKIISLEASKPLKIALAEVDRSIQTFVVAAEEAKRIPGEVMSIDWTEAGANKDAIVKYFPVGVVAGIAPFNFPLNLAVHKIAPAIAAGCPIVLKPASKTPIAALFLAQIIDQTSLPKGAFSVLPMDRKVGNQLVTDPRFNLLSFTGSPDIGWEMKKNAGKKKVILELGGNAGLIVDEDANIERAVVKSMNGAFSFAGQTCIHTQRIYVHANCFDAFLEQFKQGLLALKIGAPEQADTDFSSMIDENNAKRIESWVNEAVASGAEIVCGGKRTGTIYAPTVVTNTKNDMKVCCLEAFAPIVIIEKFTDFKQTISAINDSDFGLQTGIFTHDNRKINYAFTHLHVGGVIVNDAPTFRADHMPYGGVKDSGLGREGPKYAIFDMMEPKVLVNDYTDSL